MTLRTGASEETKALNAMLDQFEQGYLEKNIDKIMAGIASDVLMIGPGEGELLSGAAAVKDVMQKQFAGIDRVNKASWSNRRFSLSAHGDVAWGYAVVDVEIMVGGKPITMKGLRFTMTNEKREGRWVIVQSHESVGVTAP